MISPPLDSRLRVNDGDRIHNFRSGQILVQSRGNEIRHPRAGGDLERIKSWSGFYCPLSLWERVREGDILPHRPPP